MPFEEIQSYDAGSNAQQVIPVSLTSEWQTIITAGNIATADNSGTIAEPDEDIDGVGRLMFRKGGNGGTTLLLRLGYDPTLTSITAPVVKVFGKTGDDAWDHLTTRESTPSLDVTLTPAATDAVTDGLAYTTVSLTAHALDCLGCSDFIVGVKTALNGSTGSEATAILQAKFI